MLPPTNNSSLNETVSILAARALLIILMLVLNSDRGLKLDGSVGCLSGFIDRVIIALSLLGRSLDVRVNSTIILLNRVEIDQKCIELCREGCPVLGSCLEYV